MTEAFSRTFYGFISKTILGVLASESVSVEKTFTFSLYLQWGIMMSLPDNGSRKAIFTDVLLWIEQNEADILKKKNTDDIKKMFLVNKEVFTEICGHITMATPPDRLKWLITWRDLCSNYFINNASSTGCCELLEIIKESMDLKFEELAISMYLLNEVLRVYSSPQLA